VQCSAVQCSAVQCSAVDLPRDGRRGEWGGAGAQTMALDEGGFVQQNPPDLYLDNQKVAKQDVNKNHITSPRLDSQNGQIGLKLNLQQDLLI
jgi:hypothetical protein